MSPARRRASAISASRRVNDAFSSASVRRRSAAMASACAVLTCATSDSASQTRRSPTARAFRRAASTRAGRWMSSVEGVLQREFQLLGTPREEQREDRIAQQSGLDEIGAGDAEIGQGRLKGGAVPQRDRDRLVLRQAIAEVHIRRERRLAVDADACRCGSRADRGIDVGACRRPLRRCAGRTCERQRCGKRREDGSPGPAVAADRGS